MASPTALRPTWTHCSSRATSRRPPIPGRTRRARSCASSSIEFWRLQRERVGERELSDAKAYITGSFPLTIETPDAIATQVLNVLFYGLPVEQLQSYRERVNAVRTDDIERVARYYLPARPSVDRAGRQCLGVPVAASRARVQQRRGDRHGRSRSPGDRLPKARDGAEEQPLPTPTRRRGAGAAVRAPWAALSMAYQPSSSQSVGRSSITAEEGAAARALLDRVVAAKGGLERLRAVKSLVATTRARPLGPNAPTDTGGPSPIIEYPNHVRVESTIRGARDRAGLRRHPRVGARPERHARRAGADAARFRERPSPRHDHGCCSPPWMARFACGGSPT